MCPLRRLRCQDLAANSGMPVALGRVEASLFDRCPALRAWDWERARGWSSAIQYTTYRMTVRGAESHQPAWAAIREGRRLSRSGNRELDHTRGAHQLGRAAPSNVSRPAVGSSVVGAAPTFSRPV